MSVFTIGFTKKNAKTFFKFLKDAKISKLIDVRLNNVSQLAGFAKRDDLEFFLKKFDFTKEEFEIIMKETPKDPKEFQSYESMLEKLKPLVLKIKEYAKGN